MFVLVLCGVLAIGAVYTCSTARSVDRRMRNDLLGAVRTVARAIPIDTALALTGSPDDERLPQYQRLKTQLRALRGAYADCRCIYLMGMTDDGAVFTCIDSEPPGAPDESKPGEIHYEASATLRQAFEDNRATVEGPIDDRWGAWVSAFAPLRNPYTDQPVLVLGMDVDAAEWRHYIWRELSPPLLTTSLVIMIVLAGYLALRLRARNALPRRFAPASRHIEAIITGALMAALTLAATMSAREWEYHARDAAFRRLAHAKTDASAASIRDNWADLLEGLARFCENSDHIEREEFANYVNHPGMEPTVGTWIWAPVVTREERAAFEAELEREGRAPPVIWQRDDDARVPAADRPAHYPIRYMQSRYVAEDAIGFDYGSDPARRALLEEAAETRLMVATSDSAGIFSGDYPPRIVAVRAVFDRRDPERLRGFVLMGIRVRSAFAVAAMSTDDAAATICLLLFELRQNAEPRPLGGLGMSKHIPPATVRILPRLHSIDPTTVTPVLAFGRAYLLIAHPGAHYAVMPASRAVWAVSLLGAVLTVLSAAFVGVLTSRRRTLETMVQSRTVELRASEERYRALFENAAAPVVVCNRDGRIIEANEADTRFLGYPKDELIGMYWTQIAHPEDVEFNPGELEALLAGELPSIQAEKRYVRKDGRTVWALVALAGVRDEHGVVSTVSIVGVDITERKRLEDQLRQSQKMESIGRLAGGIAHDFNNMLMVILGHTEIALGLTDPSDDIHADLNKIRTAAQRSADLTRKLLAFARQQAITPEAIDLNKAIPTMLNLLRRIIGEQINMVWRPGPDLWQVRIDPTQLDQTLTNLCVNARDAIDGPGAITIETRNVTVADDTEDRSQTPPPGEYVLLSVSDTGCGIEPSEIELIFEPFYTTKPLGKGAGLGLPTVYGIAKQNNGFIYVSSELGRGTTIRIYLPREADAAPTPAPEPPAASAPLQRGNETILVAEDEPAIIALAQTVLQRCGYQVLAASGPRQALAASEAHDGPIHLLLTDVIMPEMNGRELGERIVAARPDVKVLYMSGYSINVIAEHGILCSDVQLIEKPFTAAALTERVRCILDGAARA